MYEFDDKPRQQENGVLGAFLDGDGNEARNAGITSAFGLGWLLEIAARLDPSGLVIVVDIRRGISDLDEALIRMMDHSLPLHILLTKSDKLSRNGVRQAVAAAEARLTGPDQSVSTLSTLSGNGLDALEQRCGAWLTKD